MSRPSKQSEAIAVIAAEIDAVDRQIAELTKLRAALVVIRDRVNAPPKPADTPKRTPRKRREPPADILNANALKAAE